MISYNHVTNRHQAITWANLEPGICRRVASLGHNESIKTTAYTLIVMKVVTGKAVANIRDGLLDIAYIYFIQRVSKLRLCEVQYKA